MGETLPIKVKWLKNKYDVNVMLDESVEVLKAQVRSPLHLFKKLEWRFRCDSQVKTKFKPRFWILPYLQLFDLTGVPPEKQKITAGAKQIKDDTDLKTVGLKANQVQSRTCFRDVCDNWQHESHSSSCW
jgi:hypothetical protein